MPCAAQRPCAGSSTCPYPAVYRGRCKTHARKQEMERYNVEVRRWYGSAAWRDSVRPYILARDPVCRACSTAPSVDVDHIVPHRGVAILFWDRDNLQGLCKACHSRKTQAGQ